MANNYTQSSSMLAVPQAQRDQAQEIIDKFMKQFDEDDSVEGAYADVYCGIQVELEADGVWIYGEEAFDPDQAAELAQLLLDGLELEEAFIFSWAYTCSKLRLDEFGGGACVVRRNKPVIYIDARNAVETLLEEAIKNEKQ